jgi:hypothetical protein
VQVNGLAGLLTVKGTSAGGEASFINNNNAPIILNPSAVSYISSHFGVGSSFVLLDNLSNEGRAGSFQDGQGHVLSAGSIFTSGGLKLELVTYTGDDGKKDVVLQHLNTPPSVGHLIFLPIERVASTLACNISDPDLTDSLTVTIDWGDHSQPGVYHLSGGNNLFTATHTYSEETTAPYQVQETVTDGHPDGTASAALSVTVGDAPLQLVSVGNGASTVASQPELFPTERKAFDGIVAEFNDPGNDGTVGDYSVMINWGDGSTPTKGTVSIVTLFEGLRKFLVHGSHTYTEDGKYSLHVDITDVGGSKLSANGTEVVLDAPLQAQGQNGQVPLNEKFTGIVAVFSDPGSDGTGGDYQAIIDWGDPVDAPTDGTIQANGPGQFVVYGSHQYRADGSYTVSVEIDDVGGSIVIVTGTIVVGVAPAPPPAASGGKVELDTGGEGGILPAGTNLRSLDQSAVEVILGDHSYARSGKSALDEQLAIALMRRGYRDGLPIGWDDATDALGRSL